MELRGRNQSILKNHKKRYQ